MTIRTATFNGVATIEIARPEKKNAFTGAMYAAFADALRAADADASVRAVLVTGQPGMFSSGNDIDEFLARVPAPGESASTSPALQLMEAVLALEKPLVAAVTGPAVGIGATMLLHCDLVYVADDARIAMPFVSLGLVPEFGSSLILPQLLGRVRAAEKLLLGDPMSGADAVEFGFANAVLPAGEVVNHARRIAERFNRLPPVAVRETKKLLRRAMAGPLREAIAAEAKVFAERLGGPEASEALQAFIEKRKPDFSKLV